MNELDVYYRALLGYRRQTAESDKCTSLITSIAESGIERDKITVKTATCIIDEDWVNAIEAGLIHIEKAIKMERQFIRSNGEVIPIEKVKHVSRESVEHLAKHSSLITRYEEDADIVPEKLYTVERLNDYAVYENRFLYMLLSYLRDFVMLRYNDILDLTNKYEATLDFDKSIENGKQSMTYRVSMHDVRRDDDYLREHNPAKDVIDRIDLILKTILAFLATPLMEEVGKAPMIKPPITKTNVLKMNNSFKGAVALYDFIVSYDKVGYTVKTNEKVITPFRDELAHEMAEAGGMLSFVTYEWGLGLKSELKEAYRREEERRAAEEIAQRAERIAAMKRRLKSGGVSIEDYVITLEKQLKALEGESRRAELLATEVDRLKAVEREQLARIAALTGEIEELNNTIREERQRHFEKIEALKREHEDAMHDLIVKHEQALTALKERHVKEIEDLKSEHKAQIEDLTARHEERLGELEEEMRQNEENCRQRIAEAREAAEKEKLAFKESCDKRTEELRRDLDEANLLTEKTKAEYDSLLEANRIAEARVKAAYGVEKDHTDKLSFNELEREYNAFRALYKEQWAKTKRRIRKNYISKENIKGQAEMAAAPNDYEN